MAITFVPVSQSESNALVAGGVINVSALGANAEISAYSAVHRFLYTVGGGSGAIVVIDLSDPTKPKVVAKGNPDLNPGSGSPFQTLQSAAVFGNLLAVAVQNTVKTDPGFVEFFDISNPALPVSISTLTVGALPDMVKFSGDGKKLLVTNEGEPDSLYTIDPEGSISVINTSGFLAATPVAPAQADVQTVGFGAWENRRAELINRGVRIGQRLGITTTVAQDIEPEAIAISADGTTAWVSLQENNAIAVLDLSGAQPVISSIFSAGIKDWSRGGASATNTSFTLEYAAGSANQPAGVQAGGLSGLWFDGTEVVAGASLDIYFANTDRGPNGQLVAGKRQFLDPDFQPTIYKLGANRASGAVSELGRIGLNRPDGTPLTGLPQLQGKDDIPIDSANNPLAYDPFGIDSETVSVLTVTIGGSARKVFAVGDEYRGQIALFDVNTGNLIQRYIPAGQKAQLQAQHGAVIGAETIDSLPAIYGSNRWSNRGIEGMAFNPTDGLLYAFMQSPLDKDANGTGASRSTSELTRILAIDPATGTPVKEHLYLLSGRTGQDKIGDVTYDAARGVFLVMERDSTRSLTGFKQVYEVDLRGATNTLPLTLASQVGAAAFPSETFLVGTEGRAVFREVIDSGEQAANGYRFNGTPDGIGVIDNGDGTLRVVVNHEFGATAGDVRAHGSKGAYVSDLTIDKATLSVLSGKDVLASASDLYLASADGSSWSSGTTTAFSRFCSGDLAAATAFRAGGTGYDGRIYLTGEETGAEGRAFAHVLTGSDAGKVYELAGLGNLSFENVVANPLGQAKTVVANLDDTITNGQVYIYVGTKSATGNAVEQAGLAGGLLYGVRVNSAGTTNTEVGNLASPNETGLGIVAGVGTFELVALGDVKAKTGVELNNESIAAGVTNWLRPEDGAWSKDGKTFYFVTTATTSSASRLWALEFANPANPEAGGTVKMLLNGSEGQLMLDNMTVADDGSIVLQEDPGNNARLAKIWRYNPSTDTLVELAQHNPAQFSGAGAITQDEESSGVVDISSFLSGVSGYDTSRYSYFLIADQIHKTVASPTSQVEMGELSVMATAK
ncbi:MAG: choice-of-anchor I domain-containing protein, partial [Prochlorococcaceae cyanobacterium]